MHPYVAALGFSAILLLAGTAFSLADVAGGARAEDPAESAAHAATHGGHGAGAHPYAGGTGAIPTMDAALTQLDRRSRIVIEGDDGFNPANGVRSGSGTFEDPFVIRGWHVDTLYIRDTSAAFEIKENYVGEILVLDWTGAGGYVHHNWIANLRTNRNVERTGDPTAAVIEKNEIARVEELRHFDGILRHNEIGRAPLLGLVDLGPAVTLNIAGLNGAGIHDNVIHGGVDMKLHGHHHGDASGAHSHNHGQPDAAQQEGHVERHQVRYVDFLFHNNTIRDAGFGLRYNDLAHAGDDRTATSEQEPELELPHVHHTRVTIADNLVEGATLRVAVLNSPDERHLPGQSGELRILRNRVLEPTAGDGLVVQDVADARVLLEGNRVARGDLQLTGSSGILLHRFSNATVDLVDNTLGSYRYGIRAAEFDENTTWSVRGNSAPGSDHAVYWDDSVAHPPEGEASGPTHQHQHDHAVERAAPAAFGRTPEVSRLIRVHP